MRKEYRKGNDIAYKAIKELGYLRTDRDFEIWTIGNKFKVDVNINTKRMGFLNQKELREILSTADIFLSASRCEGMSLLLLQACACECAIVATEASSIWKKS